MTEPTASFDELAELAAALCDGELTPVAARRLEQLAGASDAARRHFLQYVQLHGELYWDRAAAVSGAESRVEGGESRVESRESRVQRREPRVEPRPKARRATWQWASAAAAIVLLVVAGWWLAERTWRPNHSPTAPTAQIARLVRTVGAQWSDAASALEDGSPLAAGRDLKLQSGLAEIQFNSGVRVVLQGPAELTLASGDRAELEHGTLAATVPPAARGFAVAAAGVTVVDLGTEFGVACDRAGTAEIHVFVGQVDVCDPAGTAAATRLQAGEARRVARVDGQPLLTALAADPARFVRQLPAADAPSVARLRRLVAQEPHLRHHYTFEGATTAQRYADQRGELHLREIVMGQGRGGGRVRDAVAGFDATTSAVSSCRAAQAGNTNGMALETVAAFEPPPQMTVELLLRADALPDATEAVCAALATRDDRRKCGFLLAAVDGGHLAHLMDADAPWVEGQEQFAFAPGDWYYLAATFQVEAGQTRINTYVANLTRGERTLHWVVRDQVAPGVPAASRLGIGKGFDDNLAHAYPWAGELDEIAIYDTRLERKTLQEHLDAVAPADR